MVSKAETETEKKKNKAVAKNLKGVKWKNRQQKVAPIRPWENFFYNKFD